MEYVRVNGDKNKEYKLASWNVTLFKYYNSLMVYDCTFDQIQYDFKDIEKLEIVQGQIVLCEINQFDTYSNIKFQPHLVVGSKTVTGYEIDLCKTDIVSQINKLEEQINPVIDTDKMSVDEYKDHILKQISQQCQSEIYEGLNIKLSDGSLRKFSYKEQDQTNLKTLFDLIVMNPQIEMLPYHANSTSCEMMRREDIITIYMTLLTMLTERTTWTNQLNMYIRSLNTKEELSNVSYDMELPYYYRMNYNIIMDQTNNQIQQLVYVLLHPSNDENSEM